MIKYNWPKNYFESIDSSNKAYFLGLILSDGYIHQGKTVNIKLHIKDKDILDKFLLDLGVDNYCLKVIEDKYILLCIGCKQMVKDLEKYSITQKKSFTVSLPNINSIYMLDLIRGCWDGDGCLSRQACIISASEVFINQLSQYILNNYGNCFSISKQNNTYKLTLKISGNKFLSEIYYSNCLSINRKYNNYLLNHYKPKGLELKDKKPLG